MAGSPLDVAVAAGEDTGLGEPGGGLGTTLDQVVAAQQALSNSFSTATGLPSWALPVGAAAFGLLILYALVK